MKQYFFCQVSCQYFENRKYLLLEQLLINNIIINFARNFRENWSIGVTIINIEAINNALGIDAIALPYIGLQKKF